jgi:hypothetical protein
MSIRLTIKNYRCFVAPAVVEFNPGFTAFVGVNNAGKSALIRFLVEFRNLFHLLRDPSHLQNSVGDGWGNPFQILHVFDSDEVFSNLNDKPIELGIEFLLDEPIAPIIPTDITITVERSLRWRTKVFHKQQQTSFAGGVGWSHENIMSVQQEPRVDFRRFMQLVNVFCNTLYIGPFRNIINVGANTAYFDIQIGDAFVAQFRELKTGPSKKSSIGIQRLIDDVRKIFEFTSLSIDPSSDNHSLHITVNGKPFKQHELGSGLSQFLSF